MLVGIDEVGRGCWAGPLVAAAVALPEVTIRGLKDSKLLNRQQRQRLDTIIRVRALAIGVGWVSPQEIDSLGLSEATAQAMRRALEQITVAYTRIIIDGNVNYLRDNQLSSAVVQADRTVAAVSAASIIAKVARDTYMIDIAQDYPNYAFESHVGYGTKLHRTRLQQYGICNLHRRSFKPIQALEAS
ncbi:MAG TPA: ribonuclease HII [Candidatus Saccharimonadales bacterium]|nr:ribonuclease HII [Candidatus Saccharimonadales bacterium]